MGRFQIAYNTNGMAHHRLPEAIDLLADLGYDAVAITPDVAHLDPFAPDHASKVATIRDILAARRLACVIETGARFTLDPSRKHFPSLLCERESPRRLDFLKRCVELAHDLGARTVAMWSGHDFDGVTPDVGFDRLVAGIEAVLEVAEPRGIDIAFEPEPGMFIETLDGYTRLKERFDTPRFGLALDVGHLLVTGECDIPDAIRRFRGDLLTVTVEDMRRGVHEHLPFGRGDVEFPPLFAALHEIGYRGPLIVELSRNSHDAPDVARESLDFIQRFDA